MFDRLVSLFQAAPVASALDAMKGTLASTTAPTVAASAAPCGSGELAGPAVSPNRTPAAAHFAFELDGLDFWEFLVPGLAPSAQ